MINRQTFSKFFTVTFFLLAVFLFWFLVGKDNFFHWDDWSVFAKLNKPLNDFLFTPYSGHLLPLTLLADYFLFNIFRLNYLPYLIPMLLIHTANSFLMYLTVFKETENRKLAILSILIFGVAAVYIDVPIWSQGLDIVSAAFFVFLAYYLYLLFRETKNKYYLAISILSLLISPLFYEYGILMAFAFCAVDILKQNYKKINLGVPVVFFSTGILNLLIYSHFSSLESVGKGIFSIYSVAKIAAFIFVGIVRGMILGYIYPGLHLISGHQYEKSIFFIILFLFIATLSFFLTKNWLSDKKTREEKIKQAICFSILIFIGYLATALGRYNFGLGQAGIPRYTYQPFFFMLVFSGYFLNSYMEKWKIVVIGSFILLLLNIHAILVYELQIPKAYAHRDRQFISDVSYLFGHNKKIYNFAPKGVNQINKLSDFWFLIPAGKQIEFVSQTSYFKDNCKYCSDQKTKLIYKKIISEYQKKID